MRYVMAVGLALVGSATPDAWTARAHRRSGKCPHGDEAITRIHDPRSVHGGYYKQT